MLRAISRVTHFKTLVAWMLTPDDGSTDGKFTSYLAEPEKWKKHDPELFARLTHILGEHTQRRVQHIENSSLLENTKYYSEHVPDGAQDRNIWFSNLLKESKSSELVFLDPDNGIEIKSKPYGRKNSSKFLFWREVKSLWEGGSSLLIYQHFIRENREAFVQRMLSGLQENTNQSFVEAFSTPHVVFLLALQPSHQAKHKAIVESVQESWSGQIKHWELAKRYQVLQLSIYKST